MADSTKFEVKADLQLPGIVMSLKGFWNEQDASDFVITFMECVNRNFANKRFKVLADMRYYQPASKEVQEKVIEVQMRTKSSLIASAVIAENAIAQMQMKRIAKETGVSDAEDYFIDYDLAYNWLKSK
jgi:hypothetical protein